MLGKICIIYKIKMNYQIQLHSKYMCIFFVSFKFFVMALLTYLSLDKQNMYLWWS
jgi:hypothetical protein